MDLRSIETTLQKAGYCSNKKIDCALYASILCGRPLLIEGDPGVGKTALAKAFADGIGAEFIRVQMYEGLTVDQVLYDYDYQKQLLTLEAIRPKLDEAYKDLSLSEAISSAVKSMDFYGEDFLIRRPILRSITGNTRKVLLIDELDKASEETEYMLYEFLENYSITIPQYGVIRCSEEARPYVFLTSNSYRDLSGALRRRCGYLYIEHKTQEEMTAILTAQAHADRKLAAGIAKAMVLIQSEPMHRTPSIAEAVEFAEFLSKNGEVSKELVLNSLSLLIKDRRDEAAVTRIITANGEEIWTKEDN